MSAIDPIIAIRKILVNSWNTTPNAAAMDFKTMPVDARLTKPTIAIGAIAAPIAYTVLELGSNPLEMISTPNTPSHILRVMVPYNPQSNTNIGAAKTQRFAICKEIRRIFKSIVDVDTAANATTGINYIRVVREAPMREQPGVRYPYLGSDFFITCLIFYTS